MRQTTTTAAVAVRPVDHAETAAEAIRALNHVTLWADSADSYVWPADVDATVAALGSLVQRLPQALTQAAAWLQRAYQAGRVGHDTTPGDAGTDRAEVAAEAVATTRVLLRYAGFRAENLAADLAGIRQETAHLTGLSTDIDEDGDE